MIKSFHRQELSKDRGETLIMSIVDEEKTAKERIIDAALDLFYYQGFSKTTVRQIATQASVNQALISYYFGGKKGLLEKIMVHFYESYFHVLENNMISDEGIKPAQAFDLFLDTVREGFNFLFDHNKMTRFIYRELTLDSILIREIMTTYLAKEKYYYSFLLDRALKLHQCQTLDLEMLVLQMLNMLYMPFLQPIAIREVHYMDPDSEAFKERYFTLIKNWVHHLFESKDVK